MTNKKLILYMLKEELETLIDDMAKRQGIKDPNMLLSVLLAVLVQLVCSTQLSLGRNVDDKDVAKFTKKLSDVVREFIGEMI